MKEGWVLAGARGKVGLVDGIRQGRGLAQKILWSHLEASNRGPGGPWFSRCPPTPEFAATIIEEGIFAGYYELL
jgi:hypothetical protein